MRRLTGFVSRCSVVVRAHGSGKICQKVGGRELGKVGLGYDCERLRIRVDGAGGITIESRGRQRR